MSKLFQQLSLDELRNITRCESYEALSTLLGPNKRKFLKNLPFHSHLVKNHFSFFESFYTAFYFAQLPIQLLWLVIAFVSLGPGALWIFGGVIVFAGAVLLRLTAKYANEQIEKILQDKKELALMGIKIEATNELLRRQQFPITPFCTPLIENVLINKRERFEMGLGLTLGLAFTYWGIRDLLICIGLMSATTLFAGPLGLAIVAGIAVCFGVAFGIYHHYHQQKNNPIQSIKNSLVTELSEKQTTLKTLEKRSNLQPRFEYEMTLMSTLETKQSPSLSSSQQISNPRESIDPFRTNSCPGGNETYASLRNFHLFKKPAPIITTQTKGLFPLRKSASF